MLNFRITFSDGNVRLEEGKDGASACIMAQSKQITNGHSHQITSVFQVDENLNPVVFPDRKQ